MGSITSRICDECLAMRDTCPWTVINNCTCVLWTASIMHIMKWWINVSKFYAVCALILSQSKTYGKSKIMPDEGLLHYEIAALFSVLN